MSTPGALACVEPGPIPLAKVLRLGNAEAMMDPRFTRRA